MLKNGYFKTRKTTPTIKHTRHHTNTQHKGDKPIKKGILAFCRVICKREILKLLLIYKRFIMCALWFYIWISKEGLTFFLCLLVIYTLCKRDKVLSIFT